MRRVLSALLASAVLGCQAASPTAGSSAPGGPRPASATRAPGDLALPPLPPETQLRPIAQVGPAVRLTGKVRLISDHGAGVISNNGAGVVGSHGASLTGKVRYRTAQAAGEGEPREVLLAEAAVEVLDAQGRVLADAENRPLVAFTDLDGTFRFEGVLPAENLVLRVRLFPNGVSDPDGKPGAAAAAGGELLAMLVGAAAGTSSLDLDTASTMGAAYVLEKYVRGHQAVYDRLPAREAIGLREDLLAAGDRRPTEAPTYRRAALVAATEALRSEATAVDARLEAIAAILLAGQANLGEGRLATEVSLSAPLALGGDAAGNLYVIEGIGRVRRIGPDGKLATVRPTGAPGGNLLGALHDAIVRPDGTTIYSDMLSHAVYSLASDGGVTRLAGTGERAQGAPGRAATETALSGPAALALGPDGALYVGEAPRLAGVTGRILRITDGAPVEALVVPSAHQTVGFAGLAFTPDGALWALDADDKGELWRRGANDVWALVATGLAVSLDCRLLALPDGAVLVSETSSHVLTRVAPDGTRTRVTGNGTPGFAPDGTPAAAAPLNRPAAMWLAPDGALYLTERGNQLVRRIPGFASGVGVLETVAGARGITQQGDALAVAMNAPGGLALDPQGRLVIAETGSHSVKRLEGSDLTLVAGDPAGHGFVDGPAATARFASPADVGFAGDRCYVVDGENHVIRMIDLGAPGNPVTTVAGAQRGLGRLAPRLPAGEVTIARTLGLAVAPDGRPYWAVNGNHHVQRLNPDGTVEIVAGSPTGREGYGGDGGLATEALLRSPVGLAFSLEGDLFIADAGNMCVRKVTGLKDGQARIETIAGLGDPVATLIGAQAGNADPAVTDGKPAREVPLVAPAGLCLDPAGNLYVTELGSYFLGPLSGTFGTLFTGMAPLPARIRKITPMGQIFAIAGPGTRLLADPGGDDALIGPTGILIDREGRLVLADAGSNQIKVLPRGSL